MWGNGLGEALRRLRETRVPPVTQRGVADAIGVDPMTISRYERGVVKPPPERLEQIAAFYGISLSELFCVIEHPDYLDEILKAARAAS